ncbi:uncharacterized protein LOC121558088 [Coregonus clupeaformis]|uniref:uncharacterized protein LOC121558088 n=1 Tax=Coregonus clupeaformis TaxID=59861 RepID=UPI001E1C37F8|nr:uncharacterized protein LOC121558088 [Coregonus clupeaformis]XP_041727517.2 uncharacterized protein LOC121558088 [Coregonus clupeaformis]
MPKLTLIRLCFWLCLARTVVSGDDLYHKVGGELVLTPDKSTVTYPITSILWKHGKNKVAEWDKDFGGLEIYGAFKERTSLNLTTGISGLTKTDSGVYSVEFNGTLQDKTYKLSVIKAVPKPTISSFCNANKTSCTLTCEGNTTDAEPVTYNWKVGEGAWEVLDKQITVSKSNTGNSNSGSKYFCKMKNSAGEGEASEPVGQVFGPVAVPKPTITSSCNSNKTSCTLTCAGDTTDAEPVTYSWKVGEGAWEVIGKHLLVSKSDTGKSINSYKYICKLKKAVSVEVSEPVGDVFGPEPSEESVAGGVAGVVVVILVLVAIIIGMAGNNANSVKPVTKPEEGANNNTTTVISVGPGGSDKTTTDSSVGPGGNDKTKTDSSVGPGGNDKTTTDGSAGPGGNDKTKTDSSVGPGGNDKTKKDSSVGPGGNDKTKTDGSAGPGGNDKTKTDGSAGPGGKDETKMAGPGGDLNTAEKGEVKEEGSVLLNEDRVKYHNDNGEGAAEDNSVL